MRARLYELERFVLEAVSEDCQSFEAVVSKLSTEDAAYFSPSDLEQILFASIANKLVAAYLLHADPPYATEVVVSSENIQRYWFYITDEGRNYLDQIQRAQSARKRD